MMEAKKLEQMTPEQMERYEQRKKEWLQRRHEKEEQRKREEEEKIMRSRARMLAEYRSGITLKESKLQNKKIVHCWNFDSRSFQNLRRC